MVPFFKNTNLVKRCVIWCHYIKMHHIFKKRTYNWGGLFGKGKAKAKVKIEICASEESAGKLTGPSLRKASLLMTSLRA